MANVIKFRQRQRTTTTVAASFNGRTSDFGSDNVGSIPAAAAISDQQLFKVDDEKFQDFIDMLEHPPEPNDASKKLLHS